MKGSGTSLKKTFRDNLVFKGLSRSRAQYRVCTGVTVESPPVQQIELLVI